MMGPRRSHTNAALGLMGLLLAASHARGGEYRGSPAPAPKPEPVEKPDISVPVPMRRGKRIDPVQARKARKR